MKKLVLVVAMFMFVCGGSFLVKAQNSAEAATALAEVNATAIVNDTVVKDTVTKSEELVKTLLTLHPKTNRLSLSRNNLSKNSRNIVCRTIVSTLQKKPSLLRLFRGWLFYGFQLRLINNQRSNRRSCSN